VSIPIVPTVRVVVTFTKFVDLQPAELFFTPLSSPRHLSLPEEDHRKVEKGAHKNSWLKWGSSSTKSSTRSKSISPSQVVNHVDPFSIPSDYTWISIKNSSQRAKRSKSRKGKQKETGWVTSQSVTSSLWPSYSLIVIEECFQMWWFSWWKTAL